MTAVACSKSKPRREENVSMAVKTHFTTAKAVKTCRVSENSYQVCESAEETKTADQKPACAC